MTEMCPLCNAELVYCGACQYPHGHWDGCPNLGRSVLLKTWPGDDE